MKPRPLRMPPPRQDVRPKSTLVMLRATPDEKALWTVAARRWGGTLSDWLRTAAERARLEGDAAERAQLAQTHKWTRHPPPPTKKTTARPAATTRNRIPRRAN